MIPNWSKSGIIGHRDKVAYKKLGMTPNQLREHAKQRLDSLPPDKVRVAAEFLEYLETAASHDATAELLKMRGMVEDVKASLKQIKSGRFKDWRKVRDDV